MAIQCFDAWTDKKYPVSSTSTSGQKKASSASSASTSGPQSSGHKTIIISSALPPRQSAKQQAASTSRVAPAATHKPRIHKKLCFDGSLESLIKRQDPPSTTELLRWLEVVSHGGDIECENKRWRLQPGVRSQLTFRLDPIFVFNHPNVARAIIDCGKFW